MPPHPTATDRSTGHISERIAERIVTVGGGTGSFAMLSALKKRAVRLSAVVAMTDSGGSSRRLMDEFGRPLPLGDLRQALVALAGASQLWGELFGYRFPAAPNSAVGGHALGNLILHALQDLNGGDLLGALASAEQLLGAAGRVLPVTLARATLCAELSDGSLVRGEAEIDQPGARPILPIRRVFLDPAVTALPQACEALAAADKVLMGPGDLYTSVVPCLLVDGIAAAIRACHGEVVYVCNVMTKRGETDHYGAADFLRTVQHHLGRRVDTVVVNTGAPQAQAAARYAAQGAHPVAPEIEKLQGQVGRVVADAFVLTESLVRHDADRVIRALWPTLSSCA
ncbi:uridine diphosphate-N-acetylglucosamine-binding protein YvcK [Rubrivivax sp. A210]|uniref:gluconeogenesis factor YvcK family protein n=1 Tax=Rubrivivax sp. A210 TaxID=2772301 RepID=UPI001918E77B|nr:gluconeogenesis factor YvcK family protein [Rubrivivax sp. A210]